MNNEFYLPAHVYEREKPMFARIHKECLREIFSTRETSAEEKSQSLQHGGEKAFLNHIISGNITAVDQIIAHADANGLAFPAGTMSVHPLHQAHYLLVGGITMFCRAAIGGGLPEHIAYTISDCYIRQLDKTTNVTEVYALFLGAAREYTHAVHAYRLAPCSPPVHDCLEYISTHLHTTISLADLSRVCGLSSNYISDLFEKELGIRPIAYIRSEKLKYAGLLLRDSNISIAEISALLAFPSPSAFASQFRKQYGISPSAYRSCDNVTGG